MCKTFENRNHHFTIEQFNQVIAFGDDESMQKKWQAFNKKIYTNANDFITILQTIKEFLKTPFSIAIENVGQNEQELKLKREE
jgi:hypothetical protein